MQSGSSTNLSSRSTCWSKGSAIKVPSRSMKRIFLDTGKGLQGGVVFVRGSDGDADVIAHVFVAAAPHNSSRAPRSHDGARVTRFEQDVVGVRWPYTFYRRYFG